MSQYRITSDIISTNQITGADFPTVNLNGTVFANNKITPPSGGIDSNPDDLIINTLFKITNSGDLETPATNTNILREFDSDAGVTVENNLFLPTVVESSSIECLNINNDMVTKRNIYEDPITRYEFFDDFNGARTFPATTINGEEQSNIACREMFYIRGTLGNVAVVQNQSSATHSESALILESIASGVSSVHYALWSFCLLKPSTDTTFESRIKIPSTVGTYSFFFGLGKFDAGTSAFNGVDLSEMSHHVGFSYRSIDGDLVYRIGSRDGTTRTATVTGKSLETGYAVFKIVLDVGVPEARFYVNGALIGTKNTNLPSFTEPLCPYISMWNDVSQGRLLYIDYLSVKQIADRHNS